MRKIIFSLFLLGLFLASLSFVSAGNCENNSYGDVEVYGGVISYCNLDNGDFTPQKANSSACMNDFECQSGFCISDSCLDSSDFIRNLYQLSLPSENCTPNVTSAGCINMTYYVGLMNGRNTSAQCNVNGYSCYVCNSGYKWNSTLRNCQLIPVASTPGGSGPSGGTIIPTIVNSGGSGSCITTWVCGDWSTCSGGTQTRDCKKAISYCYASLKKMPSLNQTCTEIVSTTEYVTPITEGDKLKALKIAIGIIVVILLLTVLTWFIIWEVKRRKAAKRDDLPPQTIQTSSVEDNLSSFTGEEEASPLFATEVSSGKKSKSRKSSSKKKY